ncbi:MAG: MarR family winged helix-turn-helix transcriptional regulator [Thermoleophilia bacterium]
MPATRVDEDTIIRLRSALVRIGRRLRSTSAEEDLTPTQSGVLATLVIRGPLRAGDLAEAEGINPTMLSRVLGHLDGRGLIEREPDPDDGRCTRVAAAPDGAALVARLRERRAAVLHARLQRMPADRLAALLAALPALEDLAREEDPR